ncbi:DUF6804 family protein [Novosphingobium sp. Fuku2-ISO-50]|uniref:DUF6804 family protein n=1 Tax=Novosphingobium sp. Fuku2-ISO-50 TaxID=1739114 RepID=UPI00351067E9
MVMVMAVQRLPHRFYEDLRSYTLVLCGISLTCLWMQGRRLAVMPAAIVAAIFNPLAPFHFERQGSAVLNLASALALIFSVYLSFSAKTSVGD